MQALEIVLPGDYPATLLFLTDYPTARDRNWAIAWLQQRKFGNEEKKAAYEADLEKMVKAIVEGLLARPEFPPDVVLVPASGSRLFDPYLNKLREAMPDLVVVDGLFAKAAGFEAGVNGQTFADVLAGITLTAAAPPAAVSGAHRVLILDDIYNTGNTAGAMISHVRPSMAAQPLVTIVCALHVPLEEKEEPVDWEAAMKEVLAAEKSESKAEVEKPTEA